MSPLRLNLRLEDVRLVGGPHVIQLPRDAHRFRGELRQALAHLNAPFRGKRLKENDAHGSLYANARGPGGAGLYRLTDTNANDQFEAGEMQLLKRFEVLYVRFFHEARGRFSQTDV